MASKTNLVDEGSIVSADALTSDQALEQMSGALVESLRRSSKQIRSDRAIQIAEDAELTYQRLIEDKVRELKKMKRDLVSMLDMSPTETTSLKLASDFNSVEFVNARCKLLQSIRNAEILLDLLRQDFRIVIGKSINI